ncbi:hypothetical protein NPIL_693001 [Nephila pilipes]|uniref:Uncharacterized protein n=1 Tax=Nephila pilipes TaxID=299642 RepID=A0A8X6R1E3_NEPPI|nr:hypothetical protein NPIL_693001 [Nephila pilipes]
MILMILIPHETWSQYPRAQAPTLHTSRRDEVHLDDFDSHSNEWSEMLARPVGRHYVYTRCPRNLTRTLHSFLVGIHLIGPYLLPYRMSG